jgi:hypothetical protein
MNFRIIHLSISIIKVTKIINSIIINIIPKISIIATAYITILFLPKQILFLIQANSPKRTVKAILNRILSSAWELRGNQRPFASEFRKEFENQNNTRALANDTFLNNTLQQRTELQERLMRKKNAIAWQQKQAPIRTNGSNRGYGH